MTFEDFVLSMGFDPAKLDEIQTANMTQLFNKEHPAEAETEVPAEGETETPEEVPVVAEGEEEEVTAEGETEVEEEPAPTNAAAKKPKLNAAAAERTRVVTINRLCAEHGNPTVKAGGKSVSLALYATEKGLPVTRVKDELLKQLRAKRGTGPNVIVRKDDTRDQRIAALSCAMVMRAGVALDHKAFSSPQAVKLLPGFLRASVNAETRQRAMEAAGRFAGLSAVDICREALRCDGNEVPVEYDELFRAALRSKPRIRAANSGGSLTNIFTTSVNAVLLTTYMEADDTTMGWVKEAEVNDFKTNERPRMLKGPNLSRLPRGGEADHATRSDAGESYKIARYAKQFFMDEQDFIDDNLGALTDMPTEFGLAAARLRPDLVYSIMLANDTLTTTGVALFSASNASANLLTSAALAAAKLKAAIAALRLFKEGVVNLNLAPTHLIVPPTLENTAYELVNSTENIVAGTAGSVTERGNLNTLQRYGLTVVSDARLENGVTDPANDETHSGSASTWWLASAMAHTIEVGYRRGTGRAPRVRSWTADKEGKYGMGWDVSMDVGAKAMDWKGFVKNTA